MRTLALALYGWILTRQKVNTRNFWRTNSLVGFKAKEVDLEAIFRETCYFAFSIILLFPVFYRKAQLTEV